MQSFESPQFPSDSEPPLEAINATSTVEIVALCDIADETRANPSLRSLIDSHYDRVLGRRNDTDDRNEQAAYRKTISPSARIRSAGEVIALSLSCRTNSGSIYGDLAPKMSGSFALLLNETQAVMDAGDTAWPSTATPLITAFNQIAKQALAHGNTKLAQTTLGYSEAIGLKVSTIESGAVAAAASEATFATAQQCLAASVASYANALTAGIDELTIKKINRDISLQLKALDKPSVENPRIAALRVEANYYLSRSYAIAGNKSLAARYARVALRSLELNQSVSGWVPYTTAAAIGRICHKPLAIEQALPEASRLMIDKRADRETTAQATRQAELRRLYGPHTPRENSVRSNSKH